jgi:hypothetical protein
MSFRFYTNAISQASKAFARGTFITGLLLMGFGAIILALPAIFAFLAAAVFFIAGLGCAVTGIKIFLAQRNLDNLDSDNSQNCRVNVCIHSDEE